MALFTTTTFMSLTLPTVGQQIGPTWAQELDDSFVLVDQHDHSAGKGTPVTPAGLNITADISMKGTGSTGNNITFARSIRFDTQSSLFTLAIDRGSIFRYGNELYYFDANSVAVRLTLNGAVDTSGSGSITGMGGTGAGVAYSNVTKTWVFTQAATQSGSLDVFKVTLRDSAAAANGITLIPPAGMVASFNLTLPAALPAAANTTLWTVDNTGAVAFSLTPTLTARPTFAGINPGNTADTTAGNIRYNGTFLQGVEGGVFKNIIGWDYLGGTAPIGANATTLGLITVAARDILMIVAWLPNNGVNSSNILMRFNNDSAGNYAWRQARMASGAGTWAETTGTSATSMQVAQEALNAACSVDLEMIVGNKASLMKPVQISVGNNDSGSAATAPAISLGAGLWSNTAAQITQVEIFSSVANGLGIGACFAVFGRNG